MIEHPDYSPPSPGLADRERERLRRALAARAARTTDLRSRRAERLARLRPCQGEDGSLALLGPREKAEPAPGADRPSSVRDAEALERLLAGLLGSPAPAPEPAPPPASVVPLPRARDAAAEGAAGLATLPGAGPGLVAALIRAGVPDLAAVAALGPAGLAARLGPLSRLIDLRTWTAYAETAGS
jgi:hypothetical protein